ncbi:hypothetical protein [Pedobacter miscanthi]|uniref:hypothetical protein n=1 Tax=Pedobacter miscanthi TaxID=2259170 RepID=UPI00292CEE7D|nr:hypothetical protein [Pedobacter miscanthi]
MINKRSFSKACLPVACFLFIISGFLGCKKADSPEPVPDKKKIDSVVAPVFAQEVYSETTDLLNIFVKYKLLVPETETGIIYNTDSLSLTTDVGKNAVGSKLNQGYVCYIKLEAPIAKFRVWYKLYYKNSVGNRIYSKIYRHDIEDFHVRNKYVMRGLAIDNNYGNELLINYEKGQYGPFDNSLCVLSPNKSVNFSRYKVTINGIQVPLGKTVNSLMTTELTQLIYDVPETIALGLAKVEFYDLGKLVSSTEIVIIDGGLFDKILHPVADNSYGDYFVHNNELYTYFNPWTEHNPPSNAKFYKWSPLSKVWTKLPNPPNSRLSNHHAAQSLNGIIYFAPSTEDDGNNYPFMYKEVLWSFNPEDNTWVKNVLFSTADPIKIRTVVFGDCFVYQGKIYCIVNVYKGGSVDYEMDMYNPADKSWKKFIDLPNNDNTIVHQAVVNNGKPYLLISKTAYQLGTGNVTRNEFSEIDIDSKTLIKKSWIPDVGVFVPNLASHKGKLYAYGGGDGQYSAVYSSLSAVYDTAGDKWSPASAPGFYTAWASQTGGFFVSMNDQLYVGLGVDRYVISSKVQTNSSIYRLSLK